MRTDELCAALAGWLERLSRRTPVKANLPRGYVRDAVTGANWEQTGVVPDVPCEEAEALERALDLLRVG